MQRLKAPIQSDHTAIFQKAPTVILVSITTAERTLRGIQIESCLHRGGQTNRAQTTRSNNCKLYSASKSSTPLAYQQNIFSNYISFIAAVGNKYEGFVIFKVLFKVSGKKQSFNKNGIRKKSF